MTRGALLGLGVLAGLYGAWLLLSRQDLAQLLNAALWLVAGVVLHDVVLAPLVLLVVVLAARLLPRPAQTPAVVAMMVLGTVTVAAIPVLTGLGRRADNPTLLPRSYGVGWLVFAATVVAVAVVVFLVRSRSAAPPSTANEDA